MFGILIKPVTLSTVTTKVSFLGSTANLLSKLIPIEVPCNTAGVEAMPLKGTFDVSTTGVGPTAAGSTKSALAVSKPNKRFDSGLESLILTVDLSPVVPDAMLKVLVVSLNSTFIPKR